MSSRKPKPEKPARQPYSEADGERWTELFNRYFRKITNYVLHLLSPDMPDRRDVAKEITSRAFLKMMEREGNSCESNTALGAYWREAARNEFLGV